MKETNELKNLTVEELKEKLLSLRREELNLRLKKATGSLDKTHLIAQVRKLIARVKTFMTQKVGKCDVK